LGGSAQNILIALGTNYLDALAAGPALGVFVNPKLHKKTMSLSTLNRCGKGQIIGVV